MALGVKTAQDSLGLRDDLNLIFVITAPLLVQIDPPCTVSKQDFLDIYLAHPLGFITLIMQSFTSQ